MILSTKIRFGIYFPTSSQKETFKCNKQSLPKGILLTPPSSLYISISLHAQNNLFSSQHHPLGTHSFPLGCKRSSKWFTRLWSILGTVIFGEAVLALGSATLPLQIKRSEELDSNPLFMFRPNISPLPLLHLLLLLLFGNRWSFLG